jgi:CheY-like chemotaxis protein
MGISSNNQAARRTAKTLPSARAGAPAILLVDDNPMDVDLAMRAFERSGMSNPIDVARDGEEALAWIPRWESGAPRPAVVFLDINLPKVDGLEVVRRLKARPALRAIPVVMLSNSIARADIETAFQNGANSYVVKSADFDEFLGVVAQIQAYWTGLNRSVE